MGRTGSRGENCREASSLSAAISPLTAHSGCLSSFSSTGSTFSFIHRYFVALFMLVSPCLVCLICNRLRSLIFILCLRPPAGLVSFHFSFCLRQVKFNFEISLYPDMFAKPRYPLNGPVFNETYKDVGARAALCYETLARYAALMGPRKWIDELSKYQTESFHYVTDKVQMTTRLVEQMQDDLDQVPCLAMAYTGDYDDRFLVLSTFAGRAVCLSLRMLAENLGENDEDIYSYVVPRTVNEWLRDPLLYKLTTQTPAWVAASPGGFNIRNCVEASSIFFHFQDRGLIVPKIKAINPMEDWMMTFATGYHHQPAPRADLRELLGPLEYKTGRRPYSRQERWVPRSAARLSKASAFYLYYESVSLHLFVSRLLRQALVYGGIASIRGFTDLRSLYTKFLDHGLRITSNYYQIDDPRDGDGGGGVAGGADEPAAGGAGGGDPGAPPPEEDRKPDNHPLAALQRDEQWAPHPAPRTDEARPPSPPREPDVAPPVPACEAESHTSEMQIVLEDDELVWGEESETASSYIRARVPVQPTTWSGSSRPSSERRTTFSNEDSLSQASEDFFSARSVVLKSPKRGRGDTASPPPTGKRHRVSPPGPQHRVRPHAAVPGSRPGPPLADPSVPSPYRPNAKPPPSATITSGALQTGSSSPASSSAASARTDTSLRSTRARPSISWATKISAVPAEFPLRTFKVSPQSPRPYKSAEPLCTDPVVTYDKQDLRATINFKRQARALRGGEDDDVEPFPKPFDINMSHTLKKAARNRTHRNLAQRKMPGSLANKCGRKAGGAASCFNRNARLVDELTPEELEEHAYVDNPKFHLRCRFCAASHCSPISSDTGAVNCRRMEYHQRATATRQMCPYLRCHDKASHMIDACPALHGRCPRCACRGHGLKDRCDVNNAEIMEALLADFELHADDGFYTNRRIKSKMADRASWGFFPVNKKSAPLFCYKQLRKLPVLEALAMVRAVGALTPTMQNQ